MDSNLIEKNIISTAGNSTTFGNQSVSKTYLGSGTMSSFTRGIVAGGYVSPARLNTIEYVTFPTEGNTADFGDLPFNRGGMNCGIQASNTRGFICGGEAPVGDSNNYITRFQFASTGSAVDHADLTFTSKNGGSYSNATRAIQHRGYGAPSITHRNVDAFEMAIEKYARKMRTCYIFMEF